MLALAHMIMDAQAEGAAARADPGGRECDLRRRLPAAATSITSRKGLTVEIGNTDAEGRLVLADALALADEEKPELMVDMATLTGAARVALGPDLPPFYTDDEALAAERRARRARRRTIRCGACRCGGPTTAMLESKIADINNVAAGGYAGSITAALFLRRFVDGCEGVAASRHLRLEPDGEAGAAGRRRMPGRARALRAASANATAEPHGSGVGSDSIRA